MFTVTSRDRAVTRVMANLCLVMITPSGHRQIQTDTDTNASTNLTPHVTYPLLKPLVTPKTNHIDSTERRNFRTIHHSGRSSAIENSLLQTHFSHCTKLPLREGCSLMACSIRRDRKCTVSERCWRFITASHTSGYTLSHQILWTILGEHVGCMENIDKYARRRGMLEGTAELRHRHCSSALHHMEALMHRGAAQADQDMFLETSVLCGMLGYRDFLRADWLRTVLAWQLPSGCFGIRHTPTRRRLLGEKLLQHDCLSHKSGLGAAIMGMYARCMMDPACTWRSK
ncbi:hypothetical protein Bbelb_090880 [Branchiostoma belcheri]|nr:hypothetical protein Bbelb_090880 [Branchiostoma belcheri]